MKRFTMILMTLITLTMTAHAQWAIQTNPLGSGDAAMVGKIQFVSATEGWIACGSNGSLLHTTDGGTTWNVVTPFPGDSAGNMSDPATTMSWVNPTHGWALKTYIVGTGDISSSGNGAVLYNTIDGGTSWAKKEFPKTITTVPYNTADLQGTWQLHELVAKNPSSSSTNQAAWIHGTITLDGTGSGTMTNLISNGQSQSDVSGLTLSISTTGVLTISGSDMHGFMSADKSTIIITSTENEGGYGLMVLQRQVSGTTYATADLQGSWQMHVLSVGNNTGAHAGWGHAAMTGDASGNLTGNYVDVGNIGSLNMTATISSSGIIGGMSSFGPDAHGFMSADKKTFYMTMTTSENSDYNLVAFQKKVSETTYSSNDLQGNWQLHSIVADNTNDTEAWASWTHAKIAMDAGGNGSLSDFVVNNESRSEQDVSISISADGILSGFGSDDSNGFMSTDKSLVVLTTTDAGSGGYTFGIMQKDLTVNGDVGIQVQFADNNNGWASNYNMIYDKFIIYKSTDGGTTWNTTSNAVGGIYYFVDANNGWMIGTSTDNIGEGNLNNIYHTTDGGSNWVAQASSIGTANALYFTDLLHGWVVGKNGLILKTTDGGANWTAITNAGLSSVLNSKCVFFLDANTGWIGTHNDGENGQYVLATTDAGVSWTSQSTPADHEILSLNFWDATNGWFTSDYGQIAHYTYTPPKTVNITAGGLSSALTTTEKATLTDIVVTGTLDARDFRIMRDSMPLLANLDLSQASIAAYIGTEGTINTTNYSYPANTIPRNALLQKTSLLSIFLPNTLTAVGRSGLNGCTALGSVTFPSTLVTIDSMSFRSCTALKNVIIPSNVTEIGYAAFLASGLQQITLKEGLKKIGDYAFIYCYPLQSISIPSTVTEIGNSAFNSSGLQQITLNEGLKTIGDNAFQWCDSLRSITLPSTVTNIGYCAFTFVNSLETITVASGNSNYYSEEGVLFDKAKKRLLAYPANKSPHYDIPLGVTVIDTAAFEGNWKLKSVTIPSSVTDLASEAFYHCDLLSVIDLPSSISKIGNYCFYECYNLSAIFTNTQTPLSMAVSDSIFKEINAGCTLYTPQASSANYQSSEGWNYYITRIKEYEKVTDNEGNVYHGIQVGTQSWLVENLRTKHYTNGEIIETPSNPNVDLTNFPSTKYSWDIENDTSNAYVYGRLYTWNAATDSRGICPTGWKLPSISDWQTMITYVTNNSNASATKALASCALWWEDPDAPENTPSYNISTNNESGLLIFPSGIRHTEGSFEGLWGVSYLWSSEIQDGLPYAYSIGNLATSVNGGSNRAQEGFSIRCVKDGNTGIGEIQNESIVVYPNPTSDAFQIKRIEGTATVTLWDLDGRLLLSKEITSKENVSVSSLSNGVYLVRIKSNNITRTEKLIIQR